MDIFLYLDRRTAVHRLDPRVKRWGLYWKDIMAPGDVSQPKHPGLGAALLWVGAIGAFLLGNYISMGLYNAPAFAAGFAKSGDPAFVGKVGIVAGLSPFMLLLLAALFVL